MIHLHMVSSKKARANRFWPVELAMGNHGQEALHGSLTSPAPGARACEMCTQKRMKARGWMQGHGHAQEPEVLRVGAEGSRGCRFQAVGGTHFQ